MGSASAVRAASGFRTSIVKYLLMGAVQAAVLGLISGRADWIRAWIYVGGMTIGQIATGLVLQRRFPDLMAERSRIQPGSKSWDKKVVSIIMLLTLAMSCVAAWDVRKYWPPPVSVVESLDGFCLCGVGFWLTYRAMTANRFFSALQGIQAERGHTVCDRGPYGRVR